MWTPTHLVAQPALARARRAATGRRRSASAARLDRLGRVDRGGELRRPEVCVDQVVVVAAELQAEPQVALGDGAVTPASVAARRPRRSYPSTRGLVGRAAAVAAGRHRGRALPALPGAGGDGTLGERPRRAYGARARRAGAGRGLWHRRGGPRRGRPGGSLRGRRRTGRQSRHARGRRGLLRRRAQRSPGTRPARCGSPSPRRPSTSRSASSRCSSSPTVRRPSCRWVACWCLTRVSR